VLTAADGIEAMALLREHPEIDVLFTDIVMPRMNGLDLAQAARAASPTMKIILASGHAAEAIAENAGAANYDFVSKPYSLAQIVKKLRSVSA